jgi:PAS domain-containing protein
VALFLAATAVRAAAADALAARHARPVPAPRDAGFWGELGYRIERMRLRERAPGRERESRLAQFLSAIEASPNGVLLLDADDQIEWCNACRRRPPRPRPAARPAASA